MQAVILHNDAMSLKPNFCSMAIRAAYLLADSLRISPLDATLMQYERITDEDFHFKTKLTCLLNSFKKKEDEKENYETLLNGKILYDQVLKNKRKSKDELVYMKRFEKMVDDVFLKDQLVKIEKIKSFGYVSLCPMLQDEALEMLDDSENTIIHGRKFNNVDEVDLLQLKTPKITAPPLIFLQDAALQKSVGDFKNVQYLPEENIEDKSKPWVHHKIHINLMGIQDLSYELLKALRAQLTSPRAQLNKVMDIWINESMNNSLSFDEATYFKEQIEPAVEAIDKVIEDCVYLKAYAHQNSSYIMRIGAVPVIDLWDYYRNRHFISEEHRNTLQQKEQEKPYAERWPVFALGVGVADDAFPEEIDKEQMTNKRKVISLDDDIS